MGFVFFVFLWWSGGISSEVIKGTSLFFFKALQKNYLRHEWVFFGISSEVII